MKTIVFTFLFLWVNGLFSYSESKSLQYAKGELTSLTQTYELGYLNQRKTTYHKTKNVALFIENTLEKLY